MPPKPAFSNRSSFKPPRPAKATSSKSTSTTAKPARAPSSKVAKASKASKTATTTVIDSSDSENNPFDDSVLDDVDVDEAGPSTSRAAAAASAPENEPAIPRDLLIRLLHEHFQKPDTRITPDAATVLAKYMELFVQEAMARAARENRERGGDGFLEVEDLERIAPQLLMDF